MLGSGLLKGEGSRLWGPNHSLTSGHGIWFVVVRTFFFGGGNARRQVSCAGMLDNRAPQTFWRRADEPQYCTQAKLSTPNPTRP